MMAILIIILYIINEKQSYDIFYNDVIYFSIK